MDSRDIAERIMKEHAVLTARAPSTPLAKVILAMFVPMNLLTIPYGFVCMWIYGGIWEIRYGAFWFSLAKDFIRRSADNPARGFVGQTLGHMILLSRLGQSLRTKSHEMVHVEQLEAAGMMGFLYGYASIMTGAHWATSIAQFVLAPAAFYLCASVVAKLRGEDKYAGNFLEEHAHSHEHHHE